MKPTVSDHISISPNVCDGKPCIRGTRIRVWDIHVWHNLRGRSPEEIVVAFPQLSVADVHAALAYYHDHRLKLEQQMTEADEFTAALQEQQGETRFTRLRDQILQGTDTGDDSVSSG